MSGCDKKRKINTLDSFFIKKQKADDIVESKSTPSMFTASTSQTTNIFTNVSPVAEPAENENKHDIANYIDCKVVLKQNTYDLLKNIWYPDPNFKFPSSGPRNLKFQFSWFNRWKWLAYSKKEDGAYCKFCVFYAGERAGTGKHQVLGKLVKKKFCNWKDAVEVFQNHDSSEYHKFSVIKSQNMSLIEEKKQDPINLQIDAATKQKIEENRKNIVPIIDTIILCGRQCIPLRGHRDSGPIETFEESVENEGNFRAILRSKLRSGDESLKRHLENMSKNATYLSAKTQNEVIHSCGRIITRKIVEEVNKAKFFSVLADESSDISGIEQFSLCLRFFNAISSKIEEYFIKFVPVTSMTGQNLANVLLTTLTELGIDCSYMVGQGYDGASAMSGVFHGVQAYVREKHSCALYVHCASHSLNLAISDACNVSQARNCMGTVGKVCNFFRTVKRQHVFQTELEKLTCDTKQHKLKQLCRTRWVERHDSILTYLKLQNAVIRSLNEIKDWCDKDASSDAYALTKTISTIEFQITLQILAKIFSISLPLCKTLQTVNIDLGSAVTLAKAVRDTLNNMRENAESEFKHMFDQAVAVCEKYNIEIKVPRTTTSQTQRENVPFSSPEEYYRRAIFIPFLDSFILHLNDRLVNHENILASFDVIIAVKNKKTDVEEKEDEEKLRKLYALYEHLLDAYSFEIMSAEVKLWKRILSESDDPPKNAIDALVYLQKKHLELFPNIVKLLKTVITIPVTTASNERTFSTLRRLKMYLRNTTGEERLNGLALLNVHREISVTIDEVIDDLAKSKKRRLDFIL